MPHNHGHGPVHGHGHQDEHRHQHGGGLAELLDLDAEVMHDFLTGIAEWVRAGTGDATTVIDLGAGTGAGTLALLAQYPAATVTAVDADPSMLARLTDKAHAHGVAGRITTVEADLDHGWPQDLPKADLIWATNSMHHMADPPAVLAAIREALTPGGTFAVVEMESFPRFLPAGDGLEDRLHAAMNRLRAEDMPHLGDDWAATLTQAGFTVRATHRFEATLAPPLPPRAADYAHRSFARIREGLAAVLAPGDLAALDDLLSDAGPHGLRHRTDLTIRTSRLAWLAS